MQLALWMPISYMLDICCTCPQKSMPMEMKEVNFELRRELFYKRI